MFNDTHDPFKRAEQVVLDVHEEVGRYTKPALSRYPILFAFLTIFSFAAILHGFERVMDGIPFVYEHPFVLLLGGVVVLLLTGSLYKVLEKARSV